MTIDSLLLDIESELRKKAPLILERLDPGRSRESLEEIFEGLSLPDEVYELYMWRDGIPREKIRKLSQGWLFPSGNPLPAEEARSYYDYHADSLPYWDGYKFPLFATGGGEFFLIETDPDSPDFGMIYYHWVGAVDYNTIITRYDSLELMLTSILECYRQDIYYFDPETKSLNHNHVVSARINRQNNPRSDYWKLF